MKNLKILIKLHKIYVDETLKEISRLNGTKDLMEKRLAEITNAMRAEVEKFTSTEFGFALDAYMKAYRALTNKLQQNIISTDKKIFTAQVLLHEQFSELKKFEIALQNREEEAKNKESSSEMQEIDAVNIMRYVVA
jgi:hypothetical protein